MNFKNAIPDEAGLVKSLGMEYLNIPVTWRAPEVEALTRFMDEMDQHAGKKGSWSTVKPITGPVHL